MSAILRPHFTASLTIPLDEAMARLDAVREIGGAPVTVERAGRGRHRIIALHRSLRHFWSPWAHLDVRMPSAEDGDDPQASCVVVLRFSPNPPLWFAIMFTYLALATIAFFALCFGVSQWLAGEAPTALWALPITLAIALAIVLAARVGQTLAHEQMLLIRAALRKALGIEPDENE